MTSRLRRSSLTSVTQGNEIQYLMGSKTCKNPVTFVLDVEDKEELEEEWKVGIG